MDYKILPISEDEIKTADEKIVKYNFSIVPPPEGATEEKIVLKITDDNGDPLHNVLSGEGLFQKARL